MKFLIALALVVSSSLSFAQHADPVVFAVAHDLETREFDCDWENHLNTMSAFETNYKVRTLLTALRTDYTVNGNVIDAWSEEISNLKRMSTKIVLSKDLNRVVRVNFAMEYLKRVKVNTGTILNPSYDYRYDVIQRYAASCIVR